MEVLQHDVVVVSYEIVEEFQANPIALPSQLVDSVHFDQPVDEPDAVDAESTQTRGP